MRFVLWFLLLVFTELSAFVIPYSHEPVRTDSNHITDLICLDEPKGQPDRQETAFYFWYDEDALFVDAVCEIDSTIKKGTFGVRDYFPDADFIRLQLVTCPSDKFLYIYAAFPLGNLCDGARTGLNDLNYDWNSHYSYSSDLTDSTWTVRMRIPFRDMRIQGKPPYRWSVNVLRSYADREPNQQFGYPMVDIDHTWGIYLDQLQPIVLEHPIHKANNYRIEPYLIRTYDLREETSSYDPNHVGMNLEYRPAGTMSIKAAFNPDFSEVPSDSETDTSNLEYAQYLDENRFFFIEDLDAFGVSDSYLYTRSIAQPQYAVKMTGNTEHLTYAVLNALDKEEQDDWGETINYSDLYTVVGLRPHTLNHSLQIDVMNRYNQDEERDAWTLFLEQKSEIGRHHNLYTNLYLTDDIRPDEQRRQGSRFGFGDDITYADHTFGFSWYTTSTEFAPAIASPGSDENNGFHNTNLWYEYNHYNYIGWLERAHAALSVYYYDYYHDDLPADIGFNTNENISIRPDWYFSANGSVFRETQQGIQSSGNSCGASIGNNAFDLFHPGLSFWYSYNWRYDLHRRYPVRQIEVSANGSIDPYLSYDMSICCYQWSNLPKGCNIDDQYYVGNFNLTLNASQHLFLTSGIRFRDLEYKSYNNDGSLAWYLRDHVGTFATLRYDYSERFRFFLGYNGVVEEWSEDYQEQSKTAWFKINAYF